MGAVPYNSSHEYSFDYSKVYESMDSFDELVNPQDLQHDADSWSEVDLNVMERELGRSLEVIRDEMQFQGEILNLAKKMNRRERYNNARSMPSQQEIDKRYLRKVGAWEDAVDIIMGAVRDKLDPRADKYDSLE